MTSSIKNILRKAVDTAKETGLWQSFTLAEKKSMVTYFLDNYENLHREAAPHRRAAVKALTVFI